MYFVLLMTRRTPRSTRTDTLLPDTTLVRSRRAVGSAPASRLVRTGPRRVVAGDDRGGAGDRPRRAALDPRHRAGGTDARCDAARRRRPARSEEHTSELPSLMRSSYAVFCLKKQNNLPRLTHDTP